MPAVVIGHEGDRRVTDFRLARELCLLQVRHADDVHPPRAIQLRFSERRELWSLHADIRAALVHRGTGPLAAVIADPAEDLAEGMSEADMSDQTSPEEATGPPFRPVEELIGDDDVSGPVFLLQAADGAGRQDVLDAQRLHAEDVGAEVQLRWRDTVAAAMPREKGDALATQGAKEIWRRWFPKRRGDLHFFSVGHIGHVLQTR